MNQTLPIETTQTPWCYHEQGDANHYCILGPNNEWVVGLIHNGEPSVHQQRENMRRIVACVNACEGLSTADLEAVAGQGAPANEAVKRFNETRSALIALLDRYTGLVNSGDAGNWNPEDEPEVIAARAAIAKVSK
jgi:hypothetical protein